MYNYREIKNREEFLYLVHQQEYKPDDEWEAKELGYVSVKSLYNLTPKPYDKYFVIEDSESVLATIVLRRSGTLDYFITTSVTPYKIPSLVRTVKKLADETVEKVDVIFTTTHKDYVGALRFNELVGFKKVMEGDKFSTWAYERIQ